MIRKIFLILTAWLFVAAVSPASFGQVAGEKDTPNTGADTEAAPVTPGEAEDPASAEAGAAEAADSESLPRAPNNAAPALTAADVKTWLDGYMPYALRQGDIAGAVVTVVKDGAILYSAGYGYADLETHAPVDPARTLFRPGSVSKLFTWTAVMQLVERGRLDLDADINTYLDFEIPEAFGKPITLRHVLTHTPGFEEKVKHLIIDDPEKLLTLEEYVKSGSPARVYPPGEVPAYSNYATALAGYIVARVSGLSFEEYVERNIFAPLGMTHSTFRQPLPEEFADHMSKGYQKASDGEAHPFELIAAGPAGSLSATGEDMGRFMIAHLQNGGELLSADTARQMHETPDVHTPPLNSMRLGFYQADRNGLQVIAHGGDTQYFHSDLHLILDEGVGLYISMNSTGNSAAAGRVRGFLFDAFTDRYYPQTVEFAEPLGTAKEHAAEVAGFYEISRRIQTNFLALSGLLGQLKLVPQENGDLVTVGFKGVNGADRRWREVEPYVWREVGGKDRLALRMEDGKVTMLAMEPFSSIIVFTPPPLWRSQALIVPLLITALGVLLLTIIFWPARAIVRSRYGASFPLEGRPASAYRLIRAAALLLIVWLFAWGAVMTQMLSDLGLLDGSMDAILSALQYAVVIPVVVLVVGLWNLLVVWTHESSWFAKLWSVLLALSIMVVIGVCAIGSLFNFNLGY